MQNNQAHAQLGITLSLLALILMCSCPAFSQKWRLISPSYPTADAPVIGISVADSGATGDGVTDVTNIFQRSLNTLSKAGGGTLFVPKGKYVIKGNLTIPKGITLRGEWQQPVKGQPLVGTILMAYAGRNNTNAAAFITMQPSAQVQDLSIWYPEQLPDNIVPYPTTILFGQPNYFGNEFCNTKNLTLVNAYDGIVFSEANGGTCPVIWNIFGTPLHKGIQLDNIVDVGRVQYLDFSPAYWAGSGLPNAPAAGSGYASWILQNGTGITMRRIDWTNTAFVNVEGYNVGYWVSESVANPGSFSNGSNYSLNFSNCNTAVQVDGLQSVGFLFSKVTITGCANGFFLNPYTKKGVLQLQNCNISATNNAISIDSTVPGNVLLKQSTISSGKINIAGGTFIASDCDFNNGNQKNVIGAHGRAILTGNRYSSGSNFQNNSYYLSSIDDAPLSLPQMPAVPVIITAEMHMPSRKVLYLATAAPYNAKADGTTDNTTAIQNALNQAGADGGGIVFLPPGHYKVSGHLTVPTNVELKGANDVSSAPTGPGSILEAYADKGNAGGTPFLRLSAGSGIRGLVFNYPEQMGDLVPNFPVYPYTIQGLGSDIYIINVGIRASYNGVDLFTNKCDNHYVDYLAGHVFHTAIRVGGTSTGGRVYNLHFNTIYFANGSESKFGSWANAPTNNGDSRVYNYNYDNVSWMELGDCRNETLYNDFVYGAAYGLTLLSDGSNASGTALGVSVDGTRKSFNFNGMGAAGFPFINTQNVSLSDSGNSYIVTNPSFTGTASFFNSDYWGNPYNGIQLNGGSVNLQMANFESPGRSQWINAQSGSVNLQNASIWGNASIMPAGTESHLSARGSIIDSTAIHPANAALWKNNLGNNWSISTAGALDRKGWTATASATNGDAKFALDSNAATRWSTNGSQAPGQTFTADMKTTNTINRIVLDDSQSPSDNPAGYTVYVSTDSTNWTGPIASGTGTDGMTLILFPDVTARYIRITQTGSKGNYWSIHELYVWGKVNADPVQSIAIPGKIEAEDFDKGGQDIAYNDADAVNSGGQYRPAEGVDIENCGEGGYDVGWTNANEWMKYTVNVTTAGVYTIQARVSSPNNGSQLYVELNGMNISGTIAVPNTGNWQTYTTVQVTTPALQAGVQSLRIVELTGGFNLNYITFVRPGARVSSSQPVTAAQTRVFPNPVTGKLINVQLVNEPTGNYQVQLFNHLGQSVYNTKVSVTNGNQRISITPDRKLPSGNYILELSVLNGKPVTTKLVIP
ncbi:carbohydrate-binding protein [Niastella koreensis]|uniref:Carbohydrate binding family 6 n=2 Tax=Niastella koreensis TaxID=354356 RepID=G8T886_NIAKG|nr:glycosyl hydrolase family 28-related protein [Niastella koreensis]AEV98037.1 Carbohydrate binding family 6 [Niastella koreensis GR20-10]OQP40165.1 carbohydrate-binding protein [Niastella koreensis]